LSELQPATASAVAATSAATLLLVERISLFPFVEKND
jgi:hypothetical protein